MLSIGSLKTGFLGLLLATSVVIAGISAAHIRIGAVLKEIKILPFFLLFIFIARSLTTQGEVIFVYYGIAPTWEGVLQGLQVCWRLSLVVLISLGFIASSTSSQIKAGIEFYLSKVPFIPEKRVSTMLSLLIRFIPIIMNQVQETLDAQKARCVELRKNPVYRLVKLSIPVMYRIFKNGDQLAIAMASRCYTEQRTGPTLTASRLDWTALIVITSLVLLMQVL